MFRTSLRDRRATGSWLSDMVSNINWNPMASPVTQAVVSSTVQVAQGIAQVVTAPVTNLAAAVGVKVDWDPSKSPVFAAAKPILDIAGVAVGVGPLGSYIGTAGALTQSVYQKPAVQMQQPQTIVYQVSGGKAPTTSAQQLVSASGQVLGTRSRWPFYYR